jgi:lipopolysaccharide transport system permease protein
VLVRYKQTVIGVAWALIRPLLTMVVFTIIFGRIANLPSEGVPYPILVFAALLPWQFFSSAFTEASGSLIGNANMISKVYFPRMLVPASAIFASFVDFFPSAVILAGLMLWYSVVPSWHLLAMPLFIIVAGLTAFGAGLWVAALNVKYRDFRYIVPFVVQIGLYVSPVGFSSALVPEEWQLLYSLNPMVVAIDGFRWAVTGGLTMLHWQGAVISSVVMIAVVATGIWYFRKAEHAFADVI